MKRFRGCDDRGAVAVEFALIIPVLLLLVFGVMEFARLYNQQIELTGAARSAVRVMAIGNDEAAARAAALQAAPSVSDLTGGDVAFSSGACTAGSIISVTVSYTSTLVTGWFGPTLPLSGKAAMPCGG